jgi:ankyrin repeat protein
MSRTQWLAVVAFAVSGTASAAPTTLLEAVERQDRVAAADLLRSGADANARGPDGTTALMVAAHHADAELVKLLLGAGAEADARNDYGATALSEAAMQGATDVVAALLKGGADPNESNAEGETALMLAARTGVVDAARVLVDADAEIDSKEEWGGQTALMWAAAQSQADMIGFLLEHGADPNARGIVREWQRKITAEPRVKDMNKGGFTPLLYAAREGCIDCARRLLAGGADPNLGDPENVSPLILALENLHFDFAKFMIEAGADIDQFDFRGRTPVYVAVDFATLPTSAHGDIPSPDATTAHEVLRMLLAAGANPNVQLKRRHPYRHRALDRNADVILSVGATPLLRAARAADVESVRMLLAHGALVDLPTAEGITPLMAVAGVAHNDRTTRGKFRDPEDEIATLQLLVDHGADVNARMVAEPGARLTTTGERRSNFGYDVRGRQVPSERALPHWTAVHAAATKGWNHIIEFLARNGAELEIRDANGRTPRDLASGDYEAKNLAGALADTVALLDALIAERNELPQGPSRLPKVGEATAAVEAAQ